MKLEKLHCRNCGQDHFIPLKDWDIVEEMCCPYCREEHDIIDVETVEIVAASEVKAS